jgi:anti-anti-sigma factor
MFRMETLGPGNVKLSGWLDASASEGAREDLSRISESTIADCSGLEYISSAGIAAIMETYKRLLDRGCTFRIQGVNQRIRNIFTYAGLAGLLGID